METSYQTQRLKTFDMLNIAMQDKKTTIIILVVLSIISVFLVRLMSGEDNWICKNGQWITHGHPAGPPPDTRCGQN